MTEPGVDYDELIKWVQTRDVPSVIGLVRILERDIERLRAACRIPAHSEYRAKQMVALRRRGLSFKEIGKHFDVTGSTVSRQIAKYAPQLCGNKLRAWKGELRKPVELLS